MEDADLEHGIGPRPNYRSTRGSFARRRSDLSRPGLRPSDAHPARSSQGRSLPLVAHPRRSPHVTDLRASSTFAGCSSALGTLAQCFFTLPSGPIQTVERITPITFLPYIIFSP